MLFGALGACFFFPPLPNPPGFQTPLSAYLWPLTFGALTLFCVWKFFRGGN